MVVIAEGLPEAGLVLVEQPEPPDPLDALPEVQVGHEQPSRPPVLRLQVGAVAGERHPGLTVDDVGERKVRRVVTLCEGDHVLGARVDATEERVDRDAPPAGRQLRPLGDAMDVDGDVLRGQGAKLRPRPDRRPGTGLIDHGEVPRVEVDIRGRAGGEHWEVVDQVLAGRDQPRAGLASPTPETSVHDPHDALLTTIPGPGRSSDGDAFDAGAETGDAAEVAQRAVGVDVEFVDGTCRAGLDVEGAAVG